MNAPNQNAQKAKAVEAVVAGPALFNLTSDVGETKNVAADHPDVVARLRTLAGQRAAEVKADQRSAGQLRNAN